MSFLLSYYLHERDSWNVPTYTTEPANTANSIKGTLHGVSFNEGEFIHITKCTGNIVMIISPYGQQLAPGYVPKTKNTNRGCKKSKRVYNYIKIDNEFESFRSQVMFVIRRAHSTKIKEHKILLFRNGMFTLTGIPPNVSELIIDLLNELITFLQPYFNTKITLGWYYVTMHNYKLTIPNWSIDFSSLYSMLVQKSTDIVVFDYGTLVRTLCLPIFKQQHSSPHFIGKWDESVVVTSMPKYELLEHLHSTFEKLMKQKDFVEMDKIIHINSKRFINLMKGLQKYYCMYHHIILWLQRQKKHNQKFNEIFIKVIVTSYLDRLYADIFYHEDNIICDYIYDSEKYQGFQLKILTPTRSRLKKQTTITLFSSGRVNINGVSGPLEAQILNWWLNRFVHTYKSVMLYNKEEVLANMSDEEPLYSIEESSK